MDTWFTRGSGDSPYTLATRCAMLQELGFHHCYLTVWSEHELAELEQLPGLAQQHGLTVAGVYVVLDATQPVSDSLAAQVVDRMPPGGAVELAISHTSADRTSDPSGDKDAIRAVGELLDRGRSKNIAVRLYPHFDFWMERVDDGVRLCRALDNERLGVVFCLWHWLVVDGEHLHRRLSESAPWLRGVNVSGFTVTPGQRAAVVPLGDGDVDLFPVLASIRHHFPGPIAWQGYGIKGDTYHKLAHSVAVWQRLSERLQKHPEWASGS